MTYGTFRLVWNKEAERRNNLQCCVAMLADTEFEGQIKKKQTTCFASECGRNRRHFIALCLR